MTTATDIVTGALQRINSYQSGDTLDPSDLNDCLIVLNDLLDSWSTDKLQIFGTNEYITQWTPSQAQYKIGNPTCTDLGEPAFTGNIAAASNFVTGITNMPLDLAIGATVTDSAGVIPAGQTVTALGATSLSFGPGLSTAASSGLDSITYTIPGDFATPRPLRITGGFTRINQLDFWLDVYATQAEYTQILYKAQPGPWPTIAWYNPQFPYGVLNVYQTPGQAGELHLFTDTILSNLTATQTVILPQGYARALKWCLAKELWSTYWIASPLPASISKQAGEALNMIKALNAQPAARARYDRQLTRGNRVDGSWITHGGYNN